MIDDVFEFSAVVEVFTMKSPWIYVTVPKKHYEVLDEFKIRGFIHVTAFVGATSWDTSVLPIGDGNKFIPLKKAVRKDEDIMIGDKIDVSFKLREF